MEIENGKFGLLGDDEHSLLFDVLERDNAGSCSSSSCSSCSSHLASELIEEEHIPTNDKQKEKEKEKEEEEEEEFTCPICFDDFPRSKGVLLPCGHIYSPDCLQEFVFQFLQSGQVHNLRCPDPSCSSPPWTISDISLIFSHPTVPLTLPSGQVLSPEEIKQRFVRFKMLAEANEGGEKGYPCRKEGCDGVLVVGDACEVEGEEGEDPKNRKIVVPCRLCDTEHCGECFYIHSGEETCRQAKKRTQKEDYKKSNTYKRRREFRIAAKAFFPTIVTRCSLFLKPNVQRCPQCHKFIEKWYGCRYMRCSSCKTSFCWLCGAKGVNHGNRDHCKFNKATWPIRVVFAAVFSAVYIPVMAIPFLGVLSLQKAGVEFERGPQAFVDNFYFCNERLAGFPY